MKEVVIFTSPSCAPCKQMKPVLESLAQERGFPVRQIEMSIGNQAMFVKYGVRTVPTVVCQDGEEEIGRFTGGKTPAALEEQLAAWGV